MYPEPMPLSLFSGFNDITETVESKVSFLATGGESERIA